MRYRHEQMMRAREERDARRREQQAKAEAAFRSSLTAEELWLWSVFSDAVARVEPCTG
jgi:hypothetical protein